MHVKIVGFKCHLDSEYTFNNGELILLKGDSGAGKSTILRAIFWCLYGSMRGIYNNAGISKKCCVTLQINQLVIYRQKKPELLKVTLVTQDSGNQEYEDEIAQEVINKAFGSRDLWKSCSYIEQKERCSLLSGTASDRLTLLNQLSFDQENPKDYISRIDQELKNINKEFTDIQDSFTKELNLFTHQLNLRPVNLVLNTHELSNLQQEIISTETKIKELYQAVMNHERSLGSYNILTNQISTIQDNLSKIVLINFDNNLHDQLVKEVSEKIQIANMAVADLNNWKTMRNQVNQMEKQLLNYQEQLSLINDRIANTKNELSKTSNINVGFDVTEKLVWDIVQTENALMQNMANAQSIGCSYDQESINSLLNNLQEQINSAQNTEKNLRNYNQLKTFKQQLAGLPLLEMRDYDTLKYNLQNEISEMKKGLELLQCPKCLSSLRYANKALIPGEREPVSLFQIQEKEKLYQDLSNQERTQKNIDSLKIQIKNLEGQLSETDILALENYKPINIKQLQEQIIKISRIQIISKPNYSSDTLKQVIKYNKLNQDLLNCEKNKEILVKNIETIKEDLSKFTLPDLPPEGDLDIKKYQNELNNLHKQYQDYLNNKNLHQQLSSNLNMAIEQRNKIELNYVAIKDYETAKTLLIELKEKLDSAIYGNAMIKQQETLNAKRENVIKLNNELTSLQRLKQNAIETEYRQLQDTVDTINTALCDILPLLFDEPIVMSFQLYKTLKTTKEVKPGVNICIKYRGVEYDNINDISGGEGDRVSLAVLLALNSVSNSPIILLDECISSLDASIKEACIEVLKTFEGKTIICVDHEGTEGFYDKTVTITR